MTNIVLFCFKIFYFLKFETLSPNPHPLTLNSKSRLINPMRCIFTPFDKTIKSILVIFIFKVYICDKNFFKSILGNFSFTNLKFLFSLHQELSYSISVKNSNFFFYYDFPQDALMQIIFLIKRILMNTSFTNVYSSFMNCFNSTLIIHFQLLHRIS